MPTAGHRRRHHPGSDYPGGPLAGIELQERLESHAFVLGGSNYEAPAQLVGDFMRGKPSTELGDVEPSYKPGVRWVIWRWPCRPSPSKRFAKPCRRSGSRFAVDSLHDAVLTGIETRTSSPLRITRERVDAEPERDGLFPGGEGAGYAGGILSAGVDGIRLAEAVTRSMLAA